MKIRSIRSALFVVIALFVTGAVVYVVFPRGHPSGAAAGEQPGDPPARPAQVPRAGAAGLSDLTVRITPAERKALGIKITPAQYNTRPEQIRMTATTALDPSSLAHIHPRFAGEVTEVKVRLGQRVKKDQLLAVVWSKDLGEKKSEYIDSRSQLRLNQKVFDKLKEYYQRGAIPERSYMQTFRALEASRIAFNRAYRTLISWRLTKAEIQNIDREDDSTWPREAVRASCDGHIVEKNVIPGELVDPSVNLFVMADLSRMAIWAYATEEDVIKLKPGNAWTVTLKALPDNVFTGKISVVGAVVDPTQHTATVHGMIPNPDLILRAGMYAMATVSLAPNPELVVVPTTALIDQGEQTVVYVQSAKRADDFVRREVQVHERLQTLAFLSKGVQPGEKVVSQGALELDQKARGD